ncbi:MAG: GNAT family protein [Capsulimonadales bacterium]|nr:GNAT family protein [Capsulimonadales bacterium]
MTAFRTTERLILRPMREKDAPFLVAYRRDPEVAKFQSWTAFDEELARGFISELSQRQPGTPEEGYQMGIARRDTDELIGDLYLRLLDYDPRQAEIGYTLARPHQRRGYAREAVRAFCGYLFDDLQLHRLIAYTSTENVRSVRLLESLGFRREGWTRESVDINDRWHDEYLYALLRREWSNET